MPIEKGDKLIFQRKEKKLRCLYWIIIYLILPMTYIFVPIVLWFFNRDNLLAISKFVLFGLLTLSIIISFFFIYKLMNKYHKYEFERTKRQTIMFYVFTFLILLFQIAFLIIIPSDLIGRATVCHEVVAKYDLYFNLLNPLPILLAFVMVKIKSTKDIICGVSKLDYLLKVSVF